MAGSIDWEQYINHTAYGAPPPDWQRVREAMQNTWSHPFAQKVRTGVAEATTAWWDNVSPMRMRDKDWMWRAGFVVGLAESAVVTFVFPGSGIIKGGINFVATQGAFFAAREIDKRHTINVEPRVRNFAKGLAAGGAYGSPITGIFNQFTQGAAESIVGTPTPEVTPSPAPSSPVADTGHSILRFPLGIRDGIGNFFSGLGTIAHNVTGLGLEETPTPTPEVSPSPEGDAQPSSVADIGHEILKVPLSIRDRLGGVFSGLGATIHHYTGWGLEADQPVEPASVATETTTATPTATPEPAQPTATPSPEATPRPGATPEGARPSPSPSPTASPEATPSPKAPRPSPTTEPGVRPPAQTPEPTPATPGRPSVEPTPVPRGVIPPTDEAQRVISGKVGQVMQNKDFATSLAADVGERLPVQDEIIQQALARQGRKITDLSPQALAAARRAVQTALESQVNVSASEVLQGVFSVSPDIGPNSDIFINLTKKATKASFDQWVTSPVGHDKLFNVAQQALGEQVQAMPASMSAKMSQFIMENQNNPQFVTEHMVVRGETAGHLLMKMGVAPTWEGSDYQAFAALYKMNPGSFADLRTATTLSTDEFDELIRRIQSGDRGAYRKLIEEMGFVRAGAKVRLLTAEGMRRFLAFSR